MFNFITSELFILPAQICGQAPLGNFTFQLLHFSTLGSLFDSLKNYMSLFSIW